MKSRVQMPTLPLTSCVPLGMLFNLSVPQLPLLESGDNSSEEEIN